METLKDLLEIRGIDYEFISHDLQIKTAKEGAEYFGIDPGQTAPTLILYTEKGGLSDYFALIISGDRDKVNFDELINDLQFDIVRLATPKEVEQITGCKIGNVSLINPDIPTILDKRLFRFTHVYGGTGIQQTTLKISPENVEELNKVVAFID
ncbi:Cys-tRNA(Pro) deacylase, prolyl-tRNA editing enzyme YbaK/EbsC [Fontibacillus panacisegetis]|uniref:Cys-tRNA(Pro) deacylase, prolyl-tRNA editing enzyme YbaK/EbsC n=1 Tax=Fontibacillus panacisegetis TaxID=670482 RepID=A0A1G7GKB5_9BACL|nr:YbaK/EbsC family protein [Fontibacillus panacisegetis]SDE88565.1 Cys-tRNA(Pro) deacylase, prolyl-tRNA editing enzyme YbaK/EbsC [Fontibacillus panacisegetis]